MIPPRATALLYPRTRLFTVGRFSATFAFTRTHVGSGEFAPCCRTLAEQKRARCDLDCTGPCTSSWQITLIDIRGRVNKQREEGSDFFTTTYEGLKGDYLEAHIPGAVFVDWTKVTVPCCGRAPFIADVSHFCRRLPRLSKVPHID